MTKIKTHHFLICFILLVLSTLGCEKNENEHEDIWEPAVPCENETPNSDAIVRLDSEQGYGHFLFLRELYPCIQAPDTAEPEEHRVIYSVVITGLKQGDRIKAELTSEFTNDMPKPMFLAWEMKLSQGGPYDPHSGKRMLRPKGKNITPGQHHDTVELLGHAVVPKDGTYYLNMIFYAASGETALRKEFLKVEPGYADLYIEIKGDKHESNSHSNTSHRTKLRLGKEG